MYFADTVLPAPLNEEEEIENPEVSRELLQEDVIAEPTFQELPSNPTPSFDS